MNKKFMLACIFMIGATSLFAAEAPAPKADAVAAAVNKKVAAASNKGAINKNLRVDFRITEYAARPEEGDVVYPGEELSVVGAEVGPYEADLACKAYALDSNWLILAGTCMRYDSNAVEINGIRYPKRAFREIKSPFRVNGFSIESTHYASNGNVMLLWTGNKGLAAELRALPKVNVLAVSSPARLFALSANNTFKINTARLGSNAVRERTLKSNSIKGNRFQLDEGVTDLSGTATDPLFLFTPSGREFLAGYNDGILHYRLQVTLNDAPFTFDGAKSKNYFSLNLKDLEFIKKTVLAKRPGDWNRIKQRLFYNQTAKPYFK